MSSNRPLIEPLERRTFLTVVPDGFAETEFVSGLSRPTAMAFAPDGRLFVCEQDGSLRVVGSDGSLLPTPFLTLDVNSEGERGLLGVAFDPQFAANRQLYVYWTATDGSIHNRVSRFTADAGNANVAAAGSRVDIFDLPPLTTRTNHNGGAMHFGPDGKLYVAVGENAVPPLAQDLNSPFGKMLRINPDGSIPDDNPFFGQTSGVNRAIWALGLRNPFTFAFQPGTGRMFINDVGQSTWEEINEGAAGANYAWPNREGPAGDSRWVDPVLAYRHDDAELGGCAITGGAFYNPPGGAAGAFPGSYTGQYFFADACGGYLSALDPASGDTSVFAKNLSYPLDVDVGDQGALYVLNREGASRPGHVVKYAFSGTGAPSIATAPTSQTAAQGQPVTFAVTTSGAGLRYQWQRDGADIPGATAASYTLTAAGLADNGAQFRVVVSNDAGSVTSEAATLTVATGGPPVATITSPADGTRYTAGETFAFAGSAEDPDDGALPASAYTWEVAFHHADHAHPFVAPFSGQTGGTFTIPTGGETAADVFYRIRLAVRDSTGLVTETLRDIVPRTASVTLAANVPGVELTLDGVPVGSGTNFTGAAGMIRTLGAPLSQTVSGRIYDFVSWSDGGAATHTISTPDATTTYTATFEPRVGGPGSGPPGASADLAVDAVEVAALPAGRRAGRAVVRVANHGSGRFSGPAGVELFLSADAVHDPGDTRAVDSVRRLKLKPAAAKTLKLRFAYPTVPADGDYFLLARVSAADPSGDASATNNVGVAPTPLPVLNPVVDLSGTLAPLPGKPVARSGKGSLSLTVLNSGSDTAQGPLALAFFAVADPAGLSGPRTPLGVITQPIKLNPGSGKTLKLNFVVPAAVAQGNYSIVVEIDASGAFLEPNESDNTVVAPSPLIVV